MKKLDRRSFLKFSGVAAASIAATSLVKAFPGAASPDGHIILLVFDAWSAHNVGFLGYPRNTMPNLKRFAKNATTYHNHISAGTFTVPGTASLLTGLYPWEHRAVNLGGRVIQEHQDHTIFDLLHSTMRTVGYAQNVYADQLIGQRKNALTEHIPFGTLNLNDRVIYDDRIFNNDAYVAFNAFEDGIVQHGKGKDGSLFLGPIIREKALRDQKILEPTYTEGYYFGLPESLETYTLSGLVDGLIDTVDRLTEPSFVYFHVYTPHDPYRPYSKFYNQFHGDGRDPDLAAAHPLVSAPASYGDLLNDRSKYDAYVASWDEEIGRFFDHAERTGLKENSHILITSDHGEMFDKGLSGHSSAMLSQPLVHVPLVISSPHISGSTDIFETTSSIDVLPTIGKMAGVPAPDWGEGNILPARDLGEDNHREIYSFDAQYGPAFAPFKHFSISMIKDGLKIVYYQQKKYTAFELFDVREDPEEHQDLYGKGHPTESEYRNLLEAKIAAIGLVMEGGKA